MLQCGTFFFFLGSFLCLNSPHPWERNVIPTETNYYFYCPAIVHSQLWQPERNVIKATLVIITSQWGLLLFSQHILIPSWQKIGNECICIESAPPFCLRCLHVSDYGISFTHSWIGNLQVCVPPCICERVSVWVGRGERVVPWYRWGFKCWRLAVIMGLYWLIPSPV